MIQTINDLYAAANGMKAWCQSQNLAPHEAMMVFELFTALMIHQNNKGESDIQDKLNLIQDGIVTHLNTLKAADAARSN